MSELIVTLEDCEIYYNNKYGYHVIDRKDVCSIENYAIEEIRLRTRAACEAIDAYKENKIADQSLLEEILS